MSILGLLLLGVVTVWGGITAMEYLAGELVSRRWQVGGSATRALIHTAGICASLVAILGLVAVAFASVALLFGVYHGRSLFI